MEKFLAGYAPQACAAMRIGVGLLFFCHGLQKVFGLFGGVNGVPAPLLSLLGIAGLIELITGALIAIGWSTVMAASSPAGRWPWLTSSAIFQPGSGRFETTANSPCFTASCSFI